MSSFNLDEFLANKSTYFQVYKIRKKDGKFRTIVAPEENLKKFHRKLLPVLDKVIDPKLHNSVMGFRKNASPLINASKHLEKSIVINIDIKNFFPSVPSEWIREKCQTLLSNRMKRKYHLPMLTQDQLFELLTLDGTLAQGLPCSPILANYYLSDIGFDKSVEDRCPNWTYTRYADDLTLSTNDSLDKEEIIGIRDAVYSRILKAKMVPSVKKTKIQISKHRQDITVTGIRVHRETATVSKDYLNKINGLAKNYLIENNQLDARIKGCLAHIKSVNETQYNKLIHKIEENRK